MPLTHHPNGVSSFGIPVIGAGPILPFRGNYFFVDPTNGSDGNTGTADAPFASLGQAQLAAKDSNNDVVFFSGTIHLTATLNWAKNWVHLIGLAAPGSGQRARISSTGATPFSPLVNVTGRGCMFSNFSTFHGGFTTPTGSQVCWVAAGHNCYYGKVEFQGGGDAVAAALAGMRSLSLAADENVFEDCVVGLDTIQRATLVNATMDTLVNPTSGLGAARNIFRSSIFRMWTSLTTDLHCLIAAGTIDRFLLFDRCTFLNAINSGGGGLNAVAFTVNAAAGGSVLLQDCASVGSTVYATSGPIYVSGPVPTGATSGLAVAAT